MIMKLSKYLFGSQKEQHRLDSFLHNSGDGVFQFNNLGLRVLQNIEKIIRKNMNMIAQEVKLAMLQNIKKWPDRANTYGDTMFKLKDRRGDTLLLAPTAEEYCVELINNFVNTPKQLPLSVYQISEKFRDELRPKHYLFRTRGFIMKDAYSFAITKEEFLKQYESFFQTYLNIFKELELNVIVAESEGGEIGGDFSHEFLYETEYGESKVYYKESYATTKSCNGSFEENSEFPKYTNALELGQIFSLQDKYTKNSLIQNMKTPLIMGCYGIGITRIMAILAEKPFWLPSISPFAVHLLTNDLEKGERVYHACNNKDILYDDRDKSLGFKFNDANVIGIHLRAIIGENYEIQNLYNNQKLIFDKEEHFINYINNYIYTQI